MLDLLSNTLPYFSLIALGYGAAFSGLVSRDATVHLTQFVFYFALSAMLFQFASSLDLTSILQWPYIFAYASASLLLYVFTITMSRIMGEVTEIAITQGQCAIIGNMGWMGLAMLPTLLGTDAIPFVIMVLIVDLVMFGPLLVSSITIYREGRIRWNVTQTILIGLAKNPMILSIVLGLAVAALQLQQPKQVAIFIDLLSGASIPGALFAIGASMTYAAKGRIVVPVSLSALKLIIHPIWVGLVAWYGFALSGFEVTVMVACASMPIAANVYMLAIHYKIPADRVSISILISTSVSLVTIPVTIWATRLAIG